MIPGKAPIVWSKLTRFLHWGLVLCVAANFINDGDGVKDIHRKVGLLAAALVGSRLAYGFFGKDSTFKHHLFKYWPLRPALLIQFLKQELAGFSTTDYEGHNPAACWTYVGIWLLVLSLALTGFMMGLDAFWGEEWLEDLHGGLTKVLIVFLIIHGVGLIKDTLKHKRPAWKRMITGGY